MIDPQQALDMLGGMGGMLDVIDSLLPSAAVLYCYVVLFM